MGTRCGIYARISQDRGGAGLGVARQEADCRALAERLGWEVVEVYVDNDTSAYSGTPRLAWMRLIEDVKAGAIEAVACWHVDRLTRSIRELEDVIDLHERHGLALATVAGEIDLASPTGRMVARIMGDVARHEAEHKAERQALQRRQAAEAGKVAGGGTRPYGYADDRVTVLAAEAAVIRECAARVLAGESLASICRDLLARGVTTTTGASWKPTMLRRLLASARISGRREHTPRSSWTGTRPLLGEIVADTAVWPAIITPTDSDRLRLLLDGKGRRTNATGRTYLLSGILRCGRCGSGMVGRPRSGVPRYVCPNTPGGSSCGGMATNAKATDDLVSDLVLTALDNPAMAEALRKADDPEPGLAEAIRDDEDQLAELAADWAARKISKAEWSRARDVIAQRLDRARARAARASAGPALDLVAGGGFDDMAARWEGLNVAQRRGVVAAVLESVTVNPADPRRRWDPERFVPIWRA